MANTVTDPTWVKAKPHGSAEKQVGHADPNSRTDVINRAEKGIVAVLKRMLNGLVDGVTVDLTDQTTTTGIDSVIQIVPRGYLVGLGLANNGSDATNDIDIAAGICADSTAAKTLKLTSTLTKRLDAAWAVGTNQGGLDTGAIADTTYHVWLIKRSDTGVVDALFSTSASAPTMPASYDYKRRIGSIIRAAGAIVLFTQAGDYFQLLVPRGEWSENIPATTAQTKTLAFVPTGINVVWHGWLNLIMTAAGAAMGLLLTDLATTDTAPTAAGAGIGGQLTLNADTDVAQTHGGVEVLVRTNTSAQIRARSSSTTGTPSWHATSRGWWDTRGRDS